MADYISREAAIAVLREAADCANCNAASTYICGFCDIDNAARLINGIPAADVEPVRHGRWVNKRRKEWTKMRLIDAEILEDMVNKMANLTGGAQKEELIFAASMVKKMPTVDAVPVTRCRECIHFDPENYGGPTCAETGSMLWPNEDDYCSRGQRRDQSADVRKKEEESDRE